VLIWLIGWRKLAQVLIWWRRGPAAAAGRGHAEGQGRATCGDGGVGEGR